MCFVQQRPTEPTAAEYGLVVRFGKLACSAFGKLIVYPHPVIIDRDFSVIAGHGRLIAAKEEGIAEVPCVFVDHLSEPQKKAYIMTSISLDNSSV